ncbi:MAG: hypothetical protein ACRC42_03470 [Mycoplasma sp.]
MKKINLLKTIGAFGAMATLSAVAIPLAVSCSETKSGSKDETKKFEYAPSEYLKDKITSEKFEIMKTNFTNNLLKTKEILEENGIQMEGGISMPVENVSITGWFNISEDNILIYTTISVDAKGSEVGLKITMKNIANYKLKANSNNLFNYYERSETKMEASVPGIPQPEPEEMTSDIEFNELQSRMTQYFDEMK